MVPRMPHITNLDLPGDSQDRIMDCSGQLVGFNKQLGIWRFGFWSNSDAAKAYGVSTNGFLWVLATLKTGKRKAIVKGGYASHLPKPFKTVLEANID